MGQGGDGLLDGLEAQQLDLGLAGDLQPSIAADGQSIDFMTASGARAVRYDELVVTDATGRELPSLKISMKAATWAEETEVGDCITCQRTPSEQGGVVNEPA